MTGNGAPSKGRSGLAIPDRVRWAVELLDPQPTDRILEAGGGPGASAGLICSHLETGILVEVDRSAVAIARSATRNAAFITDGRLRLVQSSFADMAWSEAPFDAFLALDVNLFWTSTAVPEIAVIRRVLRPGGRVLILYGSSAPGADLDRMQNIIGKLTSAGFADAMLIADDGGIGVSAIAAGE